MKTFTLIETVMVVAIIAVLATFSIAGYWQLLDNARQKVCETNLETLLTATEIYALEHDALPASLSQLDPSQVRKAYAKVMRKKGLMAKLSYAFVKMNTPKLAYAQFLTYSNLSKYGPESHVFVCPSDANGAPSYGINGNIQGRSWGNISSGTAIVGGCDSHVFWGAGQIAPRHIRALGFDNVGMVITKNNTLVTDDYNGMHNNVIFY